MARYRDVESSGANLKLTGFKMDIKEGIDRIYLAQWSIYRFGIIWRCVTIQVNVCVHDLK